MTHWGDDVKDLDALMSMYNWIEYSHIYLATTTIFWQYHKDVPKDPITDCNSFKFKAHF